MSTESENANRIENAYVDEEKGTNSTISCNSGYNNSDMTSEELSSSLPTEISLVKTYENHENLLNLNIQSLISCVDENSGCSEISTPTSISSEDKADTNVNIDVCSTNANNVTVLPEISTQSADDNERKEELPIIEFSNKLDVKSNCHSESSISTFSINESNEQKSNITTTISRSVEDIHSYEKRSSDNINDLNTKDLDQERILSEFISQKNKVSATQKIVPDNLQLLDGRYTRLPKEILSQDIGSIVKNVHGIFSSVSGSLKNAYNSSQKVTQKPQPKFIKPVTNDKIMNNIFEDKYEENIIDVPKSQNVSSNCDEDPKSSNDSEQEGDVNNDMLKLQIESLERVLFEQRKENVSLRERVKQQCDELQAKDQTFKDLEAKVDLMCKRAEQAQKEKDAAVMRYASTECAAIEAKKAADAATKAERAAIVEKDLLNAKLKTAREEKQRICQLYDDKCHELQNSEREVSKIREEFRELEGRLKWTQSKLRMEMDAYKDNTEKIEKLSQQVTELEAAKEAAILNSADSARAKQLESELKQNQAALILRRHERDEFEKRLNTALQQLDACKREREEAITSLALANEQIESLKQSNIRLEEEAAELAALRAQAALADTLNAQLQRETDRALSAEQALSAERARAETCARREAAALEHAARLTAAHVHERARAAEHEGKAQALTADNISLRETIQTLEAEAVKMRSALEEETERRNKENRVLAMKVAELTEEVAEANKKLEYEQGENNVLKKKHSSAIKELNRELQRALKRIELLETKLPQTESNSTRTGSISSLSSTDSPHEERVQNGHTDSIPDVQAREPDRQALVERIVSLQRAAAARSERCEFLQEHCAQLTAELRRKAKLLRAILPDLPCHALATHSADKHKLKRKFSKSEIAQLGGGAMAAVWGGDPGGITLELSIEMNKRLQAVLEDTLLKNITLKENMDTLGEEISRLREQNKTNEIKK